MLACLLVTVACQHQLGAYDRVGFDASSSGGLPQVTETLKVLGGGASFPNRVYQDAIVAYRYTVQGISVSYTSLGSGGGKCRIKEYEVNCGDDTREPRYLDFAASDSLLTESDYERYPDLQMLPTLASAVVPIYNLFASRPNPRAFPPLRLDRLTLARVFRGDIVNWRDPAILALNPALRADMPDACIQVVARGDSSGTTEIFKKALSSFDPVFMQAIGTAPTGGPSGWPTTFIPNLYCRGIEFRDGNQGVAAYVLNTPGAIGYASLGTADYFGLQRAWMMQGQNAVEPTAESAMYAALEKGLVVAEDEIGGGSQQSGSQECEVAGINNNFTPEITDSRGMLSWPISGLTYLIIRTGCPNTRLRLGASCDNVRQAVLFWQWFYTSPAVPRIATETGFAYLPPQLRQLILDRLREVRCRSELVLTEEERSDEERTRRAQVSGRGTMFAGPILDSYASMYQRDNGIELLYSTAGDASAAPDPPMFRIVPHVEAANMALDGDETLIPWITIPIAIIYNLPELEALREPLILDALQLARLVSGSIVAWNDAGLVALNPALSNVTAGVELVLAEDASMGVAQLEAMVRALPGGESLAWELPELSAAYIQRSSYPQVEATVRELPHTVGFAPTSVLQGSSVPTVRLLPSGNHTEATPLQPNADNVAGCFLWSSPSSTNDEGEPAASGPLLALNQSSPACYPLIAPLYVALDRTYNPPRGAACDDLDFPAVQTVRWWEWLLLSSNMGAGTLESLGAVHVQLAPHRYVLAAAEALRGISCSGELILQPEENTVGIQGVPLAIVAIVAVLLLLILAGGLAFTWYRHRTVKREYRSLQLTTRSTHWDTESPYAKVIRYLKNVSTGEKLDRSEAARLVLLLQNSNNIQAPAMLQEGGRRASGTNQLARYLMSMTDGDYGGPRSESGDSAGGSLIADGSVHHGGSSIDLSARQQSLGQEELCSLLEAPPVSDFANSIIRACWFEGGIFPEDLMAMLANLGEDCFFDVVGLYELMGQRPLATVSLYMLHKFGLVASLGLDEERLEAWLLTVEEGYGAEGNSFTGPLHAADVVARFASIAGKTRGRYAFASDRSLLAGLLAAIVHDYGHSGKSNAYHVALGDYIARQFNDQQVLENLSLQKAFDLMSTPRLDFMHKSKISSEGRRKIRTLVIDMVLATDMSQHFEVLQRFQAKVATLQETGASAGGSGHGSNKSEGIVAQVILKAADLGFYAQPLRQHLFWCKALQTEMFQQGDAEKHHKLPISPMCDRSKPGVMHPNNQLGFIDVVVMPLYAALNSLFPGTEQGVLKGLTQLRATMDFYRLPKSETVTEKSLEAFREELVSQSTERYESVVGALDSMKLADLKSIRSMRVPKALKESGPSGEGGNSSDQ